MTTRSGLHRFAAVMAGTLIAIGAVTLSAADEKFSDLVTRMQREKPKFADRQQKILAERYDLSNRAAKGATMTRGKPVQEGARVKLPAGLTWEKLAAMSPEEIKSKNLWPGGFFPLPH